MDVFVRTAACILIAVELCLVLSKGRMETVILISLLTCCLTIAAAISFLEPILSFLRQLKDLAQLDADMFRILLKSVGVGIITEIVVLVCADAGHAAMGKAMQLVSAACILWLSLPVMESLLDLIRTILGGT